MFFKWVDYCEKYEAEIESWMNDEETRLADFDSIKETHEEHLSAGEYPYGEEYFCKVVLEEAEIIAVVLIFRGDKHPVIVNEFLVNPMQRNKGYGTKIIRELINNIREIIGFDSNAFEVCIYPSNKASMRAFEKAGFVLAGIHADGDCTYWVYPPSELENYRKSSMDSMDDEFVVASTLTSRDE